MHSNMFGAPVRKPTESRICARQFSILGWRLATIRACRITAAIYSNWMITVSRACDTAVTMANAMEKTPAVSSATGLTYNLEKQAMSKQATLFPLLALLVIFTLWLSVPTTSADELPKPVTSGSIHARIQMPPVDDDALLALSVALKVGSVAATGRQVMCIPAATGTPIEEGPLAGGILVEGDTDLIDRADSGILLYAFAYTELDCAGEPSEPSDDAYRVVFGGPGKPVLVRE